MNHADRNRRCREGSPLRFFSRARRLVAGGEDPASADQFRAVTLHDATINHRGARCAREFRLITFVAPRPSLPPARAIFPSSSPFHLSPRLFLPLRLCRRGARPWRQIAAPASPSAAGRRVGPFLDAGRRGGQTGSAERSSGGFPFFCASPIASVLGGGSARETGGGKDEHTDEGYLPFAIARRRPIKQRPGTGGRMYWCIRLLIEASLLCLCIPRQLFFRLSLFFSFIAALFLTPVLLLG